MTRTRTGVGTTRRRAGRSVFCLITLIALVGTVAGSTALATSKPDLGLASSFALVGSGPVTSAGDSTIVGDVAMPPGPDGLAPWSVYGAVYRGGEQWEGARAAVVRLDELLDADPCDQRLDDASLGGRVLLPGTSCTDTSAELEGTLSLDGRGDPNAVFVLRIEGSLTTAPNSVMELVGGAQACNVFVAVTEAAALGKRSVMRGTIIARQSIGLAAGAVLEGRGLAREAGVTVDSGRVSVPSCAPQTTPEPAPGNVPIPGPAPDRVPDATPTPAPSSPPPVAPPPALPAPDLPSVPGPDNLEPVIDPAFGPPLGPGSPPVDGGDDGLPAPTGAGGGFPPDLAAMRDSVVRSGSRTTEPLVQALAPLADRGLSPTAISQVGFGRFPVGGQAVYSHDWWFPRFGPVWRLHEGSDIFAERGTPVRSPTEGTVRLQTGGLGGITVYVTEPGGTYYYLAHLAGVAPGLVEGANVTTGQVVGFVGDSGNARGTPPHLHFEVHPGGGGPVDPKPFLDRFLDEAIAGVPAVLASYPSTPATGVEQVVPEVVSPVTLPVPQTTSALVNDDVAGAPVAAQAPSSSSSMAILWVAVAILAGLAFGGTRFDGFRTASVAVAGFARSGPTRGLVALSAFGSAVGRRRASVVALPHEGLGPDPIGGECPPSGEVDDSKARLLGWARDGFGSTVPTAAPPMVQKVVGLRTMPTRLAGTVTQVCLTPRAIQAVPVQSGPDRALLTGAVVTAMVGSGVAALVCSGSSRGAAMLEDAGSLRSLTGSPVVTVRELLELVEGERGMGVLTGAVVIVDEADSVPVADLDRLAGHLAVAGGCLKLLVSQEHRSGPPFLRAAS